MTNWINLSFKSMAYSSLGICIAIFVGCGTAEQALPKQNATPTATNATKHVDSETKDPSESPLDATLQESQPEQSAALPQAAADAVSQVPAENAPAPAKPKREPIYDLSVSGQDQIAAAVRRAQRDRKHVLIEWGGNWCGWCFRLHDVFDKNPEVRPIVLEEFELVLVDSNSNRELMEHYGGKETQFSFPHLTVLDAQGKVLTNQNTEPLEEGNAHNPQIVAAFLKKWMPTKIDAAQLLKEGLATAVEQNKRVIVRVGTPYCGWCKRLSQFMQDHESLFAKDYVDVSVDTLRMTNGGSAVAEYGSSDSNGDPWMVILDSSGKTMATSVGPNGNVGFPYQPEEVAHFIDMLRATRQTLTDVEIESIKTDLESFRTQHEAKKAAAKSKADH